MLEKLKKPVKQAKIKNRDLDTRCIKITVLIWRTLPELIYFILLKKWHKFKQNSSIFWAHTICISIAYSFKHQ